MTILGHDVNGRPLRAGDRVMYAGIYPSQIKREVGYLGPFTVNGPHASGLSDYFEVKEPDLEGDTWNLFFKSACRIDHQPSEYTFNSLMGSLKSGVPA